MTKPDEVAMGQLNLLIKTCVNKYLPRDIYLDAKSQNQGGDPTELGTTFLWRYSCLRPDGQVDPLPICLDIELNTFEITGVSNTIKTPGELVEGIKLFFLKKSGEDTEQNG